MEFPSMRAVTGLAHRFVLRHPEVDVDAARDEVIARLLPWHQQHIRDLGLDPSKLCLAEQVHGAKIAVVGSHTSGVGALAGVDGMITNAQGVALGIYVADCCAVYLADPVTGAQGLVHSGKRGTELGIVRRTIELMGREFGCRAQDLVVQLSPCIRPPAYEVDFASSIRRQCIESGVMEASLHDDRFCTSSDLSRFYSYRVEKGRTGRMLAIMGRPL